VNRKVNEINELPTPPPRQCWVCVPPVIALKTRGPRFALQAIVIEAQFETFTSVTLSPGSIVGVSDYWQTDFMSANGPTFPNIASSIRNKPAEGIVKQWFAGH